MNESALKSTLVKLLRTELRTAVVLRIEDRFTSGIPDIVVVGNGVTSFWEVKYAHPNFASRGVQELTLLRLARAGIARYLVYSEIKGVKNTHILNPSDITNWQQVPTSAPGFNHQFVLHAVRELHAYHEV
jgi:hypothetical protein